MKMVNSNLRKIKSSASMELMKKAKKLKEKGIDIVDLSGGEPDFNTPIAVRNAAIKYLEMGHTHYAVGKGVLSLRKAICKKVERDSHFHCDVSNVIVTPGGKYGIFMAVGTVLNPGDEVLILSPAWVSYEEIVKLWGGVPKIISLDYKKNYKIEEELLYNALSEKTKLLIINYPNNPTGRILHQDEYEILKKFILQTQLYVLSDEIYEDIVFDGARNISLGADQEISDYVITIKGFSKSAAMTGWRIGYTIASTALTDKMYKLFEHSITGVSTFVQEAAVEVFSCGEDIEWMRSEYEKRRDYLVEEINEIPRVSCLKPEGTFYLWLRIDTDRTALEICDYLLNKANIITVPGTAYGENNCTYVRCSFGNSMQILYKAMEGLKMIFYK